MPTKTLRFLLLLCLGLMTGAAFAKNACVFNPAWPFRSCYFNQEPLYDQTNPNLAQVIVPDAIFNAETYTDSNGTAHTPAPATVTNPCRSPSTYANPFYKTWLPLGPPAGDPDSLWTAAGGGCTWIVQLSATCVPTSESMAVMAEITSKAAATTLSGWMLNSFLIGTADSSQPGYLNLAVANPGPANPPLKTPPPLLAPAGGRPTMAWADVQRVANMAIKEGTNPTSGGPAGYPSTRLADFQPAATAMSVAESQVSFANASSLINSGVAPIVGLYNYTAHVQQATYIAGYVTINGVRQPVILPIPNTYNVSFSSNGGGHIVAVNGYYSGTGSDPLSSSELLAYDPWGGVRTWMPIATLQATSYTQTDSNNVATTRNLQLPNGDASIGFWVGHYPAQAFLTNPFDLKEGDQVTFLGSMNGIVVP